MGTDDDSKPFQKAKGLPIRFPRRSTLTFKPTDYRRLVDSMRDFGVYDEALKALEENNVRIVLQSDDPEGVANALAQMQAAVRKSSRYQIMEHLFNFKPEPDDEDGCPIGKFMLK